MSRSDVLNVALGERAYDIVVGDDLLQRAGELIAPVLARPRVAIVTDETVAGLHLGTLQDALDQAGIRHDAIILPPGEQTKDFGHFQDLLNRLLDFGLERRDMIVALGGGVIGDLAGFAASVLRRGVDFIQIPTTLLAQVDSSVGGKTGIDTRHGKNLVGAFHQPRLVLADTSVLATLPRRELLAGYAEVVKYGLLGDRGFFEWLESHGTDVVSGSAQAQRHAVLKSCADKARIVAADEKETGDRALLNLGHTFGHALEISVGFGASLLHGEAVAIGMRMAFGLSQALGLCSGQDAERAERHMRTVGLPVHPDDLGLPRQDAAVLAAHMAQDKKVQDGRVTFVLVHGIGEAFLSRDVEPKTVEDYLASLLD
ncbi:MAG: 3-dehydroquinate synthase [Rhodospirillaceae bacterium]|nr:3-dehydroquinate synthase [Rhodospirillaceae bacterium]|tara:strand:- start:3555 stop:4667 length:1113 start_codon:yes stop_codon:yes gene_type:complete